MTLNTYGQHYSRDISLLLTYLKCYILSLSASIVLVSYAYVADVITLVGQSEDRLLSCRMQRTTSDCYSFIKALYHLYLTSFVCICLLLPALVVSMLPVHAAVAVSVLLVSVCQYSLFVCHQYLCT